MRTCGKWMQEKSFRIQRILRLCAPAVQILWMSIFTAENVDTMKNRGFPKNAVGRRRTLGLP